MSLTTVDAGLLGTQAQYTGFKNRIINGAMVIDQRNAGLPVTPTSSAYTVDRWQLYVSQASKLSAQQNAGTITPPTGFRNYLGFTSLSAYSVTSSDAFQLGQAIEGFNIADLGWGAAGAQSVTLSFWVRSSLTGTFGGALINSAGNRSYPFTYAISSANTWEQKTIIIPGDTSGTWLTDNGQGINVRFSLGVGATFSGTAGAWAAGTFVSATGATSVVGTNGATFYITGVQLEKGSTATSFDYRPYGTELALCQRYLPCYNATSASTQTLCSGFAATTTIVRAVYPLKVNPRVPPTGVIVSSAAHFNFGGAGTAPSAITFDSGSIDACSLQLATTGATLGAGSYLYSTSASAQIQFTGCEL